MILLGNDRTHKDNIHIEVLEIKDNSILFKAVSPRNQGLPFGSRFLAEDLSHLTGGHYEIVVLGEGTLGERILAEYIAKDE
jgi:hypothetical protein